MSAGPRIPPDTWFTYGREHAPEPPRRLRAGEVTVLFDGADLRRALLGRTEIVRRIYTAIRDVNWDTVLPARSAYAVATGEGELRLPAHERHGTDECDF